jgi:hypothetical protein
MARQIENLVNDEAQYQRLKKNALLAAKELCWENEQMKLIDIYQPYL